jgi:hypothetical protein
MTLYSGGVSDDVLSGAATYDDSPATGMEDLNPLLVSASPVGSSGINIMNVEDTGPAYAAPAYVPPVVVAPPVSYAPNFNPATMPQVPGLAAAPAPIMPSIGAAQAPGAVPIGGATPGPNIQSQAAAPASAQSPMPGAGGGGGGGGAYVPPLAPGLFDNQPAAGPMSQAGGPSQPGSDISPTPDLQGEVAAGPDQGAAQPAAPPPTWMGPFASFAPAVQGFHNMLDQFQSNPVGAIDQGLQNAGNAIGEAAQNAGNAIGNAVGGAAQAVGNGLMPPAEAAELTPPPPAPPVTAGPPPTPQQIQALAQQTRPSVRWPSRASTASHTLRALTAGDDKAAGSRAINAAAQNAISGAVYNGTNLDNLIEAAAKTMAQQRLTSAQEVVKAVNHFEKTLYEGDPGDPSKGIPPKPGWLAQARAAIYAPMTMPLPGLGGASRLDMMVRIEKQLDDNNRLINGTPADPQTGTPATPGIGEQLKGINEQLLGLDNAQVRWSKRAANARFQPIPHMVQDADENGQPKFVQTGVDANGQPVMAPAMIPNPALDPRSYEPIREVKPPLIQKVFFFNNPRIVTNQAAARRNAYSNARRAMYSAAAEADKQIMSNQRERAGLIQEKTSLVAEQAGILAHSRELRAQHEQYAQMLQQAHLADQWLQSFTALRFANKLSSEIAKQNILGSAPQMQFQNLLAIKQQQHQENMDYAKSLLDMGNANVARFDAEVRAQNALANVTKAQQAAPVNMIKGLAAAIKNPDLRPAERTALTNQLLDAVGAMQAPSPQLPTAAPPPEAQPQLGNPGNAGAQ